MKKIDSSRKKTVRKTEFTVKENTELMPFLLSKMGGMSRTSVKSLLAHRQVMINGAVETKYNQTLIPGDKICINNSAGNRELTHPKLRLIHEDDHLIVVEKKEGLLTVSTGETDDTTAFSILKNHVKKADKRNRIYTVHRLDRETSGILVFAKDKETQDILQNNWHTNVKKRLYVAVVEGEIEKGKGTVTTWLLEHPKSLKIKSDPFDNGGQKAVTHYKKLAGNEHFSLLEIELETGRKNQIRVHMQGLGHSISGDKKYGGSSSPIGRIALHARLLEFQNPYTKKIMRFETAIPKLFLKLVAKKEEPKVE